MSLSMPLCNTLTSPVCVKLLRKWTENTWVPTDSRYLSDYSSELRSLTYAPLLNLALCLSFAAWFWEEYAYDMRMVRWPVL